MESSTGDTLTICPAARLSVTIISLSSQMTEGRRCQVHLLDDRKLELLVQVNDFEPTFCASSVTDVVHTLIQLRSGQECKLFFILNLFKSMRED